MRLGAVFSRGAALFFAAAALASSRGVAAEAAPGAAFVWERGWGAEACPSSEELLAGVRTLVGRDPFAEGTGSAFEGEVHREGDELVANLSTRRAGEPAPRDRALRAPADDCASLGRAVALAVALAVEHAEPRAPEVLPKAAAPAAPPARAQPSFEAEPSLVTTTGPGRVAIVPQARWSLGTLPRPTAGLGLALRARVSPRWSAALGGEWLPSATASGQFSLSLLSARLGACYDVAPSSVRVSACAFGAAGALHAEHGSARVDRAGTHAWFAGGLAAMASAPLGSSWVGEAGLEAAVPLQRPIYQGNACPPLGFQQPVATLSAFVGAGALFF